MAILTLAGFIFSVVAFDPFRLGWKSYLYCLGIAVVTPFLIHKVLEAWHSQKFVRTLAASACAAAVISLMLLAVIRGDLLQQELGAVNAVVLFDDAPPPMQNDFYGATLPLLRLVMALLALAMELGAGLALEEAWRMGEERTEDWKALRARLTLVHRRMLALAEEITALRNEPAIFAARLWRNVYHSMLTHTVRIVKSKLLLLLVLGCVFLPCIAQEQTTIIAAIDLSQSVNDKGPDQKSEFHKNVEGVSRLLGTVPLSSHIVVLGITDKSFAQPYILLSARVPDDPGYFGERLETAHRQLVANWKHRSANLQPEFKYTDITGVLLIASQIFDESPQASRKILVIFSDMRQSTPELDLESASIVPRFTILKEHHQTVPMAALRGVEVYAVGVDGAGKTADYWQSLKAFWTEYFESSGALLRGYSVLRDLPNLTSRPNSSENALKTNHLFIYTSGRQGLLTPPAQFLFMGEHSIDRLQL